MPAIVVVGAGHSGFGLAADLALRGHAVRLLDLPAFDAALSDVAAGQIAVRGIRGDSTAQLESVGSDAAAALAGVSLVFVAVPAYAHEAIAGFLAPHLSERHVVVLMPGNAGGALAFRRTLSHHGAPPITVAEASSFIFACKKDGPAGVWIRGVKRGLPVGVLPARDTDRVMALLAPLYPELRAATDVLETSLSNVNHPAHPPALLLNLARIESSGPDFSFFHEGMTPSVCRLTDVVDEERMRVVCALGYESESTLAQLVRYYGDQGFGGASYYEAVSTTPVHGAVRAPPSAEHRYFTEDIPYGLVPIVTIGETLGLSLPVTRGVVHVVDAVLGRDSFASGRNATSLGLAGLDADGMRRFALEGTL